MKIGKWNIPSVWPCKECGKPSYHGQCCEESLYVMNKKSTSSGRKFELIITEYLNDIGVAFTDQPKEWPDNVSATVIPDFRIDLPTGPLWVFAQQDFYRGGQQSSRFDHVVSMDKYAWNEGEVFYVVRYPGIAKPDAKRMTDHRLRKETYYNDLVKRQVIGTLDQLVERINGTMS